MMRRPLILLGAAVAIIALSILIAGQGDSAYVVRAKLANAGGLRTNSLVEIGGQPAGRVTALDVEGNGALVTMELDDDVGPIGGGARAAVRPANILGEKYVDLVSGDKERPQPSDTLIPLSRTGTPVELDDVLGVLDPTTRIALSVLINESGEAMTGRGKDFSRLLQAMPSSLDHTGRLLAEFAADNDALGRLLRDADRVVAPIAARGGQLTRFVGNAERALAGVAARERQIGPTLRQAPGALNQLRASLAVLQDVARPLKPASDDLRRAAPDLQAVLKEIGPFANAARPTLRDATRVAPDLVDLGRKATPVLERLRPLAGDLTRFGTTLDGTTAALQRGFPDTLGTAEGWARTIQSRDKSGHMFRTDPALTSDTLKAVVGSLMQQLPKRTQAKSTSKADAHEQASPPASSTASTPQQRPADAKPKPKTVPELLAPLLGRITEAPKQSADSVKAVLDYLLK